MKRAAVLLCLASLCTVGCERENRRFTEPAAVSNTAANVAPQSGIHPGGTQPTKQEGGLSAVPQAYLQNAWQVAEGKRLYSQYNCVGCHALGGGSIGPALMDDQWLYGANPQDIYNTIVHGRPNGMPAFRGKIPAQQVWQLVAYVKSMNGSLRQDVAPGRGDHMSSKPSEQDVSRQKSPM